MDKKKIQKLAKKIISDKDKAKERIIKIASEIRHLIDSKRKRLKKKKIKSPHSKRK